MGPGENKLFALEQFEEILFLQEEAEPTILDQVSTNSLKFWKHFEILSPDGSSRPAPDPEAGSCDVFLICLFSKFLELTGVWL